MQRVFICHASQDNEKAKALAERLAATGEFDCWYDGWELKSGDNLVAKINQGLAEAEFGIVLVSKSGLMSAW